MLLDLNQLWLQDVLAVQDTVQVQGSELIHPDNLKDVLEPEPAVYRQNVRDRDGTTFRKPAARVIIN